MGGVSPLKNKTANKRRTLAKIFSRELVRELRALFFSTSSLKRLPVAAPSAADELLAALCRTTRQGIRQGETKTGHKTQG